MMNLTISGYMICSAFALSLAACDQKPTAESSPTVLEEMINNECPLANSSNWRAWLNRMPGPGEPKLHIIGDVEYSEPGLTASFSLGLLDRRRPPSQRIMMTVQKSDGAEEIKQSVKADFPALADDYQSIVIVCGDDLVATVTDIEVAQ